MNDQKQQEDGLIFVAISQDCFVKEFEGLSLIYHTHERLTIKKKKKHFIIQTWFAI